MTIAYAVVINNNSLARNLPSGPCHGQIEECRVNDYGQSVIVTLIDGSRIFLTIPSAASRLHPGDSISFNCRLQLPAAPDNHNNDYRTYLWREQISFTGYLHPDSLTVTGKNDNLLWRLRNSRITMADILAMSDINGETGEFLTAIVLGDTSRLPDDTRQAFSTAGISHILALSGLHIGVIMAMALALLSPFRLIGLRKLQWVGAIILLWIYAVVTGLSPSILRAVIMATVLAIGFIIERRYIALNALMLAAILILLIHPIELYAPGFQLSFVSIGTILLFNPLINRIDPKRRILYYVTGIVTASLIGTLSSGVVAAWYFHSFPVYFLIANTPVLPALPFLLGGGGLLIFTEWAGITPGWLTNGLDALYGLLDRFVSFIASLPGATIENVYFHHVIFIPYFITIGLIAFMIWRSRKRLIILPLTGVISTVLIALLLQEKVTDNDLFFLRDNRHPAAILRDNDRITLFTPAPELYSIDIMQRFIHSHSDYLKSHKADKNIEVIRTDTFSVGKRTFAFIASDTLRCYHSVTHAIICPSFHGDIVATIQRLNVDTVLLPSCIQTSRRRILTESLQQHSIPVLTTQ